MHFLTIFSLVLLTTTTISAEGNLVCYFTSWTTYRPGDGKYTVADLPADLCTHIHYSFVGLQEWDGKLNILDDWEANGLFELEHLKQKRVENPNLKLIVSMGGWNEGSEKYSKVSADPTLRAALVSSVLEFLQKYEFNGFDLDWEYPAQRGGVEADVSNFITLLRELHDALTPKGYLLSIAVSGGIQSAKTSYDFTQLGDVVDYINVMAYDYHGAFEPYVGHFAPLYASSSDQTDLQKELNVFRGMNFWVDQGIPRGKMNLGIGPYGRCFTLADPNNSSLYAPTNGGCAAGPFTRQVGTLGYNEICLNYPDYEYVWDDEQKVPHIVKGNQWIGFDDVRSVELKVQFAKSLNIGGLMVWSLDTDDFHGACGKGSYPLINTMKKTWNN